MMTAFEWAIPLIGAAVAGLGALWLRWSGKRIGRTQKAAERMQKDAESERATHERLNEANTGGGATDAERVRWLESIANDLRDD